MRTVWISRQLYETSALWTERTFSLRVYSFKFLLFFLPVSMAMAEALMPAITSFPSVQAMDGKQFHNVSRRFTAWDFGLFDYFYRFSSDCWLTLEAYLTVSRLLSCTAVQNGWVCAEQPYRWRRQPAHWSGVQHRAVSCFTPQGRRRAGEIIGPRVHFV